MTLKWNETDFKKKFGFNLDHIHREENRFHAIYFIDSLSGAVLISNQYSDKSAFSGGNEDLISGFLCAINMFVRELNSEKEEIQEINFKDTRILYERKGRLVCIGISKKTNLQLERGILHQVLLDFYEKFEQEISNFRGVIDPKMVSYQNKLENVNLNSLFKFNLRV